MAKSVAPRKVIEMMKEATGASDDEVCLMLQLCDGDPNKATEALLSSACLFAISAAAQSGRARGRSARMTSVFVASADPFQQVESKKDKRAKVSSQQSINLYTRQVSSSTCRDHCKCFWLQVEEQRKKEADQQRRSGVDTRRAAQGFPGGRGGRGGRFEGRGGRGTSLQHVCEGPCMAVVAAVAVRVPLPVICAPATVTHPAWGAFRCLQVLPAGALAGVAFRHQAEAMQQKGELLCACAGSAAIYGVLHGCSCCHCRLCMHVLAVVLLYAAGTCERA